MDSRNLTAEHLEDVRKRVLGILRYLNRLVDRMHKLAFPPEDETFMAAVAARNALHHLTVKLHYLACDNQAGRKRLR